MKMSVGPLVHRPLFCISQLLPGKADVWSTRSHHWGCWPCEKRQSLSAEMCQVFFVLTCLPLVYATDAALRIAGDLGVSTVSSGESSSSWQLPGLKSLPFQPSKLWRTWCWSCQKGSSPEGVSQWICKATRLIIASPWIDINEACEFYWNLHCPDEKDDPELNQALLLEAGFVPLYPWSWVMEIWKKMRRFDSTRCRPGNNLHLPFMAFEYPSIYRFSNQNLFIFWDDWRETRPCQVTNKPPRSPSGDAMDPSPIEVGLKICLANASVHPISWSLQKLVSHMCFLASFLSIHKLHVEGTEICLPVLWCCSFFSLDGFLYKLEMQCVPMRICILTS